MLAPLLLVLCASGEAPRVTLERGEARVLEQGVVRTLDPRAAPRALTAPAWLESGAGSSLALVWRGQASAYFSGPASFALEEGPGLTLEAFQSLELEVRRGSLALRVPGLGALELGTGVLALRALPGGVLELHNRGGARLELTRPGREPLRLGAGQRLRLRPEA